MVFLVFFKEEKLIGWYGIACSILADLHFNGCVTVRAKKGTPAPVPPNGRIPHVTIPCPLLGKHGIYALIPLLVHGIKAVQIRDVMHDHGVGVRKRFPDLAHPFFCDVRGTHDNAKGLSIPASFLRGP